MCIFFRILVQKSKFWHLIPFSIKTLYFVGHYYSKQCPIKTGFHLFVVLLKRVCRVTVHSYPAICRLAYTAHTRLIHGSSVRFAQASIRSDRLHTARLGTLTASGLNGSVRLYTINYKQKMALHLLLRTETFMFLHKYFILHWHSKSHN